MGGGNKTLTKFNKGNTKQLKAGRTLGPTGGTYTPPGSPQTAPQGPTQPPIGQLNDSGYNADIAGLDRNYNAAQTGLDTQQYALRSQFGFDNEFAQNPYTRANMLTSAYNKANMATRTNYAARGQQYSGARDRAASYDAESYQKGLYDTRGEYDRELANIESQRLAAENEKLGGADKAYAAMLDRYYSQDPDASLYPDEEPMPGGNKAGKGGGSKGGKKPDLNHGKAGLPKKKKVDPRFNKPTKQDHKINQRAGKIGKKK